MKLISWNVNGIRAVARSGNFMSWFEDQKADVVCVQEIKAHVDQLQPELVENILNPFNYHSYWHSAKKAGYSGVAIYSKKEPLSIQEGIGKTSIDSEGRVLVAEYKDFFLINAYFPNSQQGGARLGYKLEFCNEMILFLEKLKARGKNVVLCGDLNIAHREIDLKNPKKNVKNAGFLPEERAWIDSFLNQNYIDTFRHFHPEPNHYTWWSYRSDARTKNIGWRIDYFVTNGEMKDRLKNTYHQPEIKGSDHCPVVCELKT